MLAFIAVNQLFWGFCIGFVVSTALSLIIITGGVRNAGRVITNSADKSYKSIVPGDPAHPKHQSFEQFLLIHRRARMVALIGIIMVLAEVLYFVVR